MLDRGIAQDQVDALLARPEISLPNPDLQAAPGTRLYIHGGVVAVIDEPEHTVITIGITGATNRDWESFSPPEAGPLPPQSPSLHHRRRRVKEKGLPVARRNVLDGVHPGIAAGVRAYLAAHNLDFRAVQVHGPMQVEINPPAAQ
jgi:hypothetical protein